MQSASILTVGEVARRSGLAGSAGHFYEREGLIHRWRSPSNQRRDRKRLADGKHFLRHAIAFSGQDSAISLVLSAPTSAARATHARAFEQATHHASRRPGIVGA